MKLDVQLEVTGAAYTDPVRLQQVVADLDGASLLGADLGRAEATLAADPWVKRVRVERKGSRRRHRLRRRR